MAGLDIFMQSEIESEKESEKESDEEEEIPIITSTKNALITTQTGPCEAHPHQIKISIIGAKKIGVACAIAITMRRLASQICCIDQDEGKASGEAEDIQHGSVFLGCPLITGTSDMCELKDSSIVIITLCEKKRGEKVNLKHNFNIFKKIIPTIAKLACKAVLVIATQPNEIMSYITWKLSKFPPHRVVGLGTLLDTNRMREILSQKFGLACTSIICETIGTHESPVCLWSNVHVGGTNINYINPNIGRRNDSEKWYKCDEDVQAMDAKLNEKLGNAGPNCWALGICISEIVDAIVRNTKEVLTVATKLQWRSAGALSMAELKKKSPDIIGNTVTFLLTKTAEGLVDTHRVKVAVVGSGPIGVAVVLAVLFKRLASEVVLIDKNEDLAKAEAEDISHAAAYLGNPRIIGTKDYESARDAIVCVIAADGNQSDKNQEPADLQHNLEIFKEIVPNICKYAPNSVLVILSNPVDILSYVAMKLSGFPRNRVIGLGTFVDSCRFQYFIAQEFGLSPTAIQAWIIGEHGSASVWSSVSIMGMPLKDINKNIGSKMDRENWQNWHTKAINTDQELIRKKGYHSWGVGICACEIIDAIVRNTFSCFTVSTFLKGCRHGLEKDVFMSLPCMLGRNGVQSIIRLSYTPDEAKLINKSAQQIYDMQKSILNYIKC